MKSRFVFILLLALMLSVFSIGDAATVQIGSGSGSTGSFPLSGSYAYSYTQQIYTQSQINCAGTISKIRFYYVSGTIDNNKDLTIYLGHTQKDTFSSTSDWVAYSDLTQVFSGDVSSLMPASTYAWMEITLSAPFAYNNIDNLVVAVDENTPDSGNMRWGAFTSGSNTGIYYRDNTTNPDPNNPPNANGRTGAINCIQLEITSTAAPLAPTLVSPADGAYAFDSHSLSWASTVGSAGVTGYDVYLDGNLESSNQTETSYPLSSTMGLGQHTWYVVARNELGDSPASETRAFELVDPVVITGSPFYSITTPFNIYNGYGRSLGLYTTAQMGQVGQVMGFAWNVHTASTRAIPYKIYVKPTLDDALSPMTWDAFTDGATLVKEGTHTFDSTGWNTFALDMPFTYAGSNLLIGVEANYGSGAGSTNTPKFRNFNGGSGSHQQWQGANPPTGNGSLNIYLPHLAVIMKPASNDPAFVYSPTGWNVGSMKINTTTSRNFTIGNAGSGTLNVTGISPMSDGYFSITDAPAFPLSLNAGQTSSFKIKYNPMSTGNHTATFTITHTNGTTDLTVSGECWDPTISSFPHLENFDGEWSGAPAAPHGWTVVNANNDGCTWTQSNSGLTPTPSEPYAAYGAGNTNDWLISPPFDLGGINARVRWWDKVQRSDHTNAYRVKVSTTTPEIASFTTELATIICRNTDWTQHTLDLDAYRGQTIYLAFHQYLSASFSSGFGLDDFRLEEMHTDPDILAGVTYPVESMGAVSFVSSHDLWTVPNVNENTGPIALLPNLNPDNANIAGYTCPNNDVSLTFTISEPGTWYLVGYWSGSWNHGTPAPLTVVDVPGTITLSGIDFTAKGDVYVVLSKGDDPTLPVELSHFAATLTAQNYVLLSWTTQSESDLMGYYIYRNDTMDLSSAIKISELIEGTNTSGTHTYTYYDKELEEAGTYSYWLQIVNRDGSISFHGPINVDFSIGGEGGSPGIPLVTKLENAYPNPFNPNTSIRYQLESPGKVKIDIYNARGQLVRSFERSHDAAGYYQISWDGRDSSGKSVSSGVYQYKMRCGSYHSTKKMVLKK